MVQSRKEIAAPPVMIKNDKTIEMIFLRLIEGLEGRFEVWRADLRHGEANFKARGLI